MSLPQQLILQMMQSGQLYLDGQFLSLDDCERMLKILQNSRGEQAGIQRYAEAPVGREQLDDVDIRRTTVLQVPPDFEREVLERINVSAQSLCRHFRVNLSRCEKIQFLHYQPGDYFKPHRDWSDTPIYRERKLTLVLFFNGSVKAQKSSRDVSQHEIPLFEGGELNLFMKHKTEEKHIALGIFPEAGMLAAFRPHLLHEVSSVTAGDRYALVTWLL